MPAPNHPQNWLSCKRLRPDAHTTLSLPLVAHRFEAADYLGWEAEQAIKHEYIDGEVFAMAGASEAHVTIAGNIYMVLRNHLRGGPCSVFISVMKLQVAQDNAFHYPDVFVTCAEADRARSHFKSEPVLVIEVLSPSTSAFDRGAKFASYRKLASLQEYAVIDTERLSVDVFRREGTSGRWVLDPLKVGQAVSWSSVALSMPIERLYEDVRFEPPQQATG